MFSTFMKIFIVYVLTQHFHNKEKHDSKSFCYAE